MTSTTSTTIRDVTTAGASRRASAGVTRRIASPAVATQGTVGALVRDGRRAAAPPSRPATVLPAAPASEPS
ncbi:MAG: hypothetical protein AAGC46_20480, partial [Solirubrobacteraceae bacterium]|nr:hypothetical protein [Patulibacter sp.]